MSIPRGLHIKSVSSGDNSRTATLCNDDGDVVTIAQGSPSALDAFYGTKEAWNEGHDTIGKPEAAHQPIVF